MEMVEGSAIAKYINVVLLTYGPKVIGGLITLILGLWVIKCITGFARKKLERSKIDDTLVPFLSNMINVSLKVMLVISVASMVGIKTTSFIAVLGAAGLAIGMALQGSLANFAGGVLILIFRPFKVGSYIKAQGHEGTVTQVLLFVTVLKSVDNKIIYLPNGSLASGAIVNLNQEDTRRVDMTFGIGYGDNIDEARTVFKEVLAGIPEVLSEPPADILVTELADNSVNFSVRPWAKTADYWTVYAKAQEEVKKALDAKGISIPYPQRDIHIHNS
jgi:small conductance mechanosensitive channel